MPANESLMQYRADGFIEADPATQQTLLVADSFLVENGRVRAAEHHAERFLQSCISLANLDPAIIRSFWQASLEKMPHTGAWFPRFELVMTTSAPKLQFRLRQAPERQEHVHISSQVFQDARTQPRHKGPDIAFLSGLRQQAINEGAEEAMLCTPAGFLLEGCFAGILWWEEETLCQTPPTKHVLPSVTASLLKEIAARLGTPFAYRSRRWQALDGCEIWFVNALHGIRRVVNWTGSPLKVGAYTDLSRWQTELKQYAQALPALPSRQECP